MDPAPVGNNRAEILRDIGKDKLVEEMRGLLCNAVRGCGGGGVDKLTHTYTHALTILALAQAVAHLQNT